MTYRWVEISLHPEEKRFKLLSALLNGQGIANEVEFITTTESDFETVAREAMMRFDQIRVGTRLCELAPNLSERKPSSILTLKASDALVRSGLRSEAQWWPRNFLFEGVGRAVVSRHKDLDLGGAVFVLGVTCESRAVIAALAKIGFSRFSISHHDDNQGQAFVEGMRRALFGVQFQFVPRHLITQLPSVHSFAVNTLLAGTDDGALAELIYFNFLKPGGIWLDLSLAGNPHLEAEARAVGAVLGSGVEVAAWTDHLWSKEVFGCDVDPVVISAEYERGLRAPAS